MSFGTEASLGLVVERSMDRVSDWLASNFLIGRLETFFPHSPMSQKMTSGQ